MNTYSLLTLLLLMNAFSLCGMQKEAQQPPLKRTKSETPSNPSIIYSPHSLVDIAAQRIVKDLELFDIATLPQSIRDRCITPHLKPLLQKMLCGSDVDERQILSSDRTSTCHFTKDGTHILCHHPYLQRMHVYSLAQVLKGNSKTLDHLYNPSLYAVANAADDFYSITYHKNTIEQHTITPFASRFMTTHSAPIRPPLSSAIIRVAAHPTEGLYVVSYPINPVKESPRIISYVSRCGINTPLYETTTGPIQALHPLSDTLGHIVLVYYDGSGTLLNFATKSVVALTPTQPSDTIIVASSITPSATTLIAAYNNNKAQVYDLVKGKNSCITLYARSLPGSISALQFYDNEHLITAHKKGDESSIMSVVLWNIESQTALATFIQPEWCQCNNITFSPSKQYLLMGMGQYDSVLRSMDSFVYDIDALDLEKMYTNPGLLCAYIKQYQKEIPGILKRYNTYFRFDNESPVTANELNSQKLSKMLSLMSQTLFTPAAKMAFMNTYAKREEPK